MSFNPSQRPIREWPLLLLAVALVCAICVPLWQWTADLEHASTEERIARLLLGPEQIACYCCFVWACFILGGRWLEVRRQRGVFRLNPLPTEVGLRILPEDARPLLRRVEQASRGRPYILTNMLRLALNKYAVSRSGRDVSETVRIQADVDMGRLISGMAMVHYLAWAIPAVGFLGTVRGLTTSLTFSGQTNLEISKFIDGATRHLNVAFDCTLVALALSVVVMFLLHTVQREEEALVIDCQQYALENLVTRLYEPEPEPATPLSKVVRA